MPEISPSLLEASLADLAARLARGEITSVELAQSCLRRVAQIDSKLRSVLSVAPRALEECCAADLRRARNERLGLLDGLPILVKDNIETAGLATTAGSLALIQNIPRADAPVVQALRQAGMIVIGKSNLSEWANFRSSKSTSGWSALGGLTRNPYDQTRSACGSSSGSAAAVAAGLVPAAIGTETDGSIVWPAAICGIVGLKPTKGLISQHGIIPISHDQDTAGPLTRTVEDVGWLLGFMCGKGANYLQGMNPQALKSTRLGALRNLPSYSSETLEIFEKALEIMRAQGATIVDIDFAALDTSPLDEIYLPVLLAEFKAGINAYLATANAAVVTRTLAELIAFNNDEPRELEWFGQELFESAQRTSGLETPGYHAARARIRDMARINGIDRMLIHNDVAALVAPTNDPAWPIALGLGDDFGGSVSTLPAAAGYPHLTVPSGYVRGLPVGLSFIGPAWSEHTLLSLGFAFEVARGAPRAPHISE